MTARKIVLVWCLLAVVVLLAGCSLVGPPSADEPRESTQPGAEVDTDPDPNDPEPDPAALFEAAFVHGDDLIDVSGVRTTEISDGDETATEVVSVAERPYVEYRSEILESTRTDRDGDVYVSNATSSWWYDPSANAARYYQSDEPFESDDVRAARAEQAERQLALYDLEYRGTETVADRETHVLAVEAKDEAVEDGISILVGDTEFVYALETVDPTEEVVVLEQRLWIDAEYDYPLKEELRFEGEDGERHTMVERFDEVTFNDDLPDDEFDYEPPENATISEIE
ncbi:LolA family protein [Natrarchaeobius oligotrophus]|uniref:Outer membrane lipoprotein carrier protein LolA n=1 Tax=Natrarchaeobius chitinivorans TaxID=1679083 RepID=A0A3N6MN97_NATCH|nr:outer membrane lipoprotein carrier protein LolA [Natrarchaeobius chitinivorans]RQH03115.1 outer membrane lipoprotein carrier protein LolA [Natrarchaeobius chitinivorans]